MTTVLRYITLSCCILASTSMGRQTAQAEQPPERLRKIGITTWDGKRAPLPSVRWRNRDYYVVRYRWNVSASISGIGRGGSNDYPLLEEGDIVAMFGYVYRVSGEVLKWVEDGDLLAGAALLHPDSLAAPLGGGVSVTYRTREGKETTTGVRVKEISEDAMSAGIQLKSTRDPTTTIRRGETLQFGLDSYTVKNIVPRNEETGVVGWVELAPKWREQRRAVITLDDRSLTLRAVDGDAGKLDAMPPSDPKENQAWISTTYLDEDDNRWNAGIWTNAPQFVIPEKNPFNPSDTDWRPPRGVKSSYPPLTKGHVLPLFGKLYRVTEVEEDALTFRELAGDDAPDGLSVKPDSIIVPLRSRRGVHAGSDYRSYPPDGYMHLYAHTDHGEFDSTPVYVAAATPVYGKAWAIVNRNNEIGRGVMFLFNFSLRNRVSADPETGVIGWIELAPAATE